MPSKDASNYLANAVQCQNESWAEFSMVLYGRVLTRNEPFKSTGITMTFCSGKGISRLIHSTVPRAKVPKETDERHAKRVALGIRPGIKLGPFKAAKTIHHTRRNLWNQIDYTRLKRPFFWCEMLGDPWNVILFRDNLHAQKASLLTPDPGL